MDPNFKPYRTGMVTVLERYPCGKGNRKGGRENVFYYCRCDCGNTFIVSGDELSRHPYSCGCTPKPEKTKGRTNEWALGYGNHTMTCMIKPGRAVYVASTSGVSGVAYESSSMGARAPVGSASIVSIKAKRF